MESKLHQLNMRKAVAELEQWFKEKEPLRKRNEVGLKKSVAAASVPLEETALDGMLLHIGVVAYKAAVHAAIRLLHLHEDGWAHYYHAAVYDIANLSLSKSCMDDGVFDHDDIFLAGMVAYILGDDKAFVHSVELYEKYPKFFMNPPRRYMVALAQFIRDGHLKKKRGPAPTTAKAGPYADVIKHWGKDKDKLVKAIAKCCDYHLERRDCFNLSEGDEFAEPFHLIPVEIMALQKLAREQGVEFPEVKHPLLEVKLPPLPKKTPEIKDPTFQKIKKEFLYFNKDLRHKVKK